MNERRDDTTETGPQSPPARAPSRYYYDDATGYEPYTPAAEDEEPEDEEPEDERRAPGEA